MRTLVSSQRKKDHTTKEVLFTPRIITLCLVLVLSMFSLISQSQVTKEVMKETMNKLYEEVNVIDGENTTENTTTSSQIITTNNNNNNNTILEPLQNNDNKLKEYNNSDIFNLLENNTMCRRGKRTVSCPCGKFTHHDYRRNMAHIYRHYNHADDLELVKKCFDLEFPLKRTDPIECWPRMFIAPSYPTSGNALSRQIYSKALNMNYFMDQYKEGRGMSMYEQIYPFPLSRGKSRIVGAHCVDDYYGVNEFGTTLPIPMMGKAAIFKTHGPRLWKHPPGPVRYDVPGGSIAGILRLARNPGDQIIRDLGRFYSNITKDCYKTECFKEEGRKLCDTALDTSHRYNNWHNYWNVNFNNTKQHIYHYEHFSHPDYVVEATTQVIEFLEETPDIDLESLKDLIVSPSYTFGTILVDTCGLEYATSLHEITKDISEGLGYKFDYEKGTWSLPEPKKTIMKM